MKKIKRLPEYAITNKTAAVDRAKINELVDFANKHQEEHEGLLDAIKTVYAPEIEGKIFSSGRGTDQPKETKECKHEFDLNISPYCKLCGIEFASKYKPKADKIAELIKDYAHDYRDMELDEPHFGAMLKEFLEAIETL